MYSSHLIESISCFGKTVPFPKNAGSVFDVSDGKFQAFQTDQCFVSGFVRDDGSGAVYFITDNSLIKVQMPFDDADEEYNRSAVSFYCENGELLYTRQPVKYFCPDKSAGGIVEKCLSRDELFSESGRVIILDDKIEFDPLETVTVSEATDLENEFSAWSRARDLDPEMTLDDYLELNGRLFGRARDSEENAPQSNGLSFMIKQDGTVIIPSIGADDGNNADMVLIEAMGIIESGCYDFPEGVSYRLAVGKAMIELDSSAVAGTDQTSFTVRSVSYGDNTVSSVTDPDGEEIRINGNLRFQAFDTEECFVLGYMNSSGAGTVYLIGGESSIKTVMPLEDTNALYNRTVISFYSRSGKLLYRRQPQKYYQSPQVQGEKIEKCVSRDELYCEYGTAVIEGRKVVYNPVLSKSVSEALDLEEEYSLYRKARNTSGNGVSLDDFLKSNLETYESYEIIE